MMEVWLWVLMLGFSLSAGLLYLYMPVLAGVQFYADRRAVLNAGHDLDAGGTFRRRLTAGEVQRRGYLWLLAQRAAANRVYTLVTLAPEKVSPQGKGAVAIKLGKQTLGYLSRKDAHAFRSAQKANGWPKQGVTCPAAITRRHTTGYGVWLDLPALS